jgi:hypothetical protein
MRPGPLVWAPLLLLMACDAELSMGDPADGGGISADAGAVLDGAPAAPDAGSSDAGPLDGGRSDDPDAPPELRSASLVCSRWNQAMAETAEAAAVDFDVAGCVPGTSTPEGLDDALRRVNHFRWLNGLTQVGLSTDAALVQAQQECALMMSANRALSHGPPEDWACFSEGGASSAATSNLSLGRSTASASVNGFMVDGGSNNYAVGHRRWFLSERLATVAFGTLPRNGEYLGSTCAHVFDQSGEASERPFAAFPNPGPAPIEQLGGNPDDTRWSVQAGRRFFEAGDTVRLLRLPALEEMPLRTDPGNDDGFFARGGAYGNASALVWIPDFEVQPGAFRVVAERDGVELLSYETRLVACEGVGL